MINTTCEGCTFEWDEACDYVRRGLHLATFDEWPGSFPGGAKHFGMILVDDDGKVMVW